MSTTREELLERRRELYRRLAERDGSGAGEAEIEELELEIERLEGVLC